MVKIGSVTAEIFLIWTNAARTNIAWTNVNMKLESATNSKHLLKVVPGTYL